MFVTVSETETRYLVINFFDFHTLNNLFKKIFLKIIYRKTPHKVPRKDRTFSFLGITSGKLFLNFGAIFTQFRLEPRAQKSFN
jgi:hypothetical protein